MDDLGGGPTPIFGSTPMFTFDNNKRLRLGPLCNYRHAAAAVCAVGALSVSCWAVADHITKGKGNDDDYGYY